MDTSTAQQTASYFSTIDSRTLVLSLSIIVSSSISIFFYVKNSSGIGTNLMVEVAVATNFSC